MKQLTFNELTQLESGTKVIRLQDGDELSFIWISAIHRAKKTFVYLTEKIGSDKCVCIGNDKYFSGAIYFLPENRNDKEFAAILIEQLRRHLDYEIKAIKTGYTSSKHRE